jgi:hypothetical protein
MMERKYYKQAAAALDAAHKACLNHPDRGVLGMSHGPFSGVNEALGIIAEMEALINRQAAIIKQLKEEKENV